MIQYIVHKQITLQHLSKYIENGFIAMDDINIDNTWYDLLKENMNKMGHDAQHPKLSFHDTFDAGSLEEDDDISCLHRQCIAFQLNINHIAFENILSNKLQKTRNVFTELGMRLRTTRKMEKKVVYLRRKVLLGHSFCFPTLDANACLRSGDDSNSNGSRPTAVCTHLGENTWDQKHSRPFPSIPKVHLG